MLGSRKMNTISASVRLGHDKQMAFIFSNSVKSSSMTEFISELQTVDSDINAELTKIITDALQEDVDRGSHNGAGSEDNHEDFSEEEDNN